MRISLKSVRFVLPSVCLLLGFWLPSAGTSAQAVPWPGRIPASIHLGMPRAEVWKHIGKPPETHALRVAGQKYTWDEWDSDRCEWAVISQWGRVVQTEYRCHADVLRHPTFADFRRQHPHVRVRIYELREEVGASMVVDDVKRGVAWTLYVHHRDDPGINILGQIGPLRIIKHRSGAAFLPDVDEVLNEADPLRHDFSVWFAAGASRG